MMEGVEITHALCLKGMFSFLSLSCLIDARAASVTAFFCMHSD